MPIKAGLAHRARCRATTCRCSTTRRSRCPPGIEGAICDPAAAAARHAADAVAGRRALRRRRTCRPIRRLLPHRRRRLHRRGRLRLRHGPHRRRPQRRRPPPLDRVDRGGARRAPGRRRVRGHRRRRRASRARCRAALVVLKAGVDGDGRRRADPQGARAAGARRGRCGRGLRQVDIVAALPKTRSGKILRKTMREIADGGAPPCPAPSRTRACSSDSARCFEGS